MVRERGVTRERERERERERCELNLKEIFFKKNDK